MKPTKENIARWVRAYGIAQDFDLEDGEAMLASFAEVVAPELPFKLFEPMLDRWAGWIRLHKAEAKRSSSALDELKNTVIASTFEVARDEVVAAIRHRAPEAEVNEVGNLVYPQACKHISSGEQREIERLELDMRVLTLDPPADYRYGKGPDTIRLCAVCAGVIMGVLIKHEIFPKGEDGLTKAKGE